MATKIKANDKESIIYQAVLPLLAAAQNRAREVAIAKVNELREQLKVENDVQKFSPYPRFDDRQYKEKKAQHNFALYLTNAADGSSSRRPREPNPRIISEEKVEQFIEIAMESAAASFETYVAKLFAKINANVIKAELEGRYVWSTSHLTVTLEDGAVQIWKTQMIINCSKYGKLFNQWPTRLVKSVKWD